MSYTLDFCLSYASQYPVFRCLIFSSPFYARQIPYAIGQFTVNELCHEIVYRNISEETKQSLSGTTKFGIALGSGIIAGFAAAVLSHVSTELHDWLSVDLINAVAGRHSFKPD